MSVLVDTNILLRRIQQEHANYTIAIESVAKLLAANEVVYFTLQNISEFWNVMTRPIANNGLGFSTMLAINEIAKIEKTLMLLPESPATYDEWKRLVIKHNVLGSKVHDTKLVAAMNVHGIRKILTFNTGDFARYDVDALHPSSLFS